jgi:LysM domain
MSTLSATPSITNRTARRAQRGDLPRLGASRLQLVPNPGRPAPSGRASAAGSPSSRVGSATAPTRLRLTRRGRIVVRVGTAALILLGVVAGVLLLGRPAQAGSQVHQVPASYRVVLPGETLWQIAGEVAPKTDRRDTVARIIELNALPGAHVLAGQRIAVPVPAPK